MDITSTIDVMFEARVNDENTISTTRVAADLGFECKVQGFPQHLFRGFTRQVIYDFYLKQNSTYNYPEDGPNGVIAATMLASNVLHRIPGSVEITSTYDVLFKARVDDVNIIICLEISVCQDCMPCTSQAKSILEIKKGHRCFSDLEALTLIFS